MTALPSLFSFFEDNLARNFPQYAGGFVCPFCLRRFPDISRLNKAHLWPKALGGRIYTLSCKKCNSKIGTSIEKHEVERVKISNQEKTFVTTTIKGVAGYTKSQFLSEQVNGKPFFNLIVDSKHSNPYALAEERRLWETGEMLDRTMTLSFRFKFNKRRATLTYLHFAYISLFHCFGYESLFTEEASKVLEQLAEPTETLFPVLWTVIEKTSVSKFAKPDQPILFEYIGEMRFDGYIVASPELAQKKGNRLGVWIPKTLATAKKLLTDELHDQSPYQLRYLGTICARPGQHAKC